MKEITGTAEALEIHPRTDGSVLMSFDLVQPDGTTVRVHPVIPADAHLVDRIMHDSRYHQPATHLRAA